MSETASRRAQDMLDTRAIELATLANSKAESAYVLIGEHVKSCASWQRAQLIAIIVTLMSVVGVLVKLYVLPPSVTTFTSTETHIVEPAPRN